MLQLMGKNQFLTPLVANIRRLDPPLPLLSGELGQIVRTALVCVQDRRVILDWVPENHDPQGFAHSTRTWLSIAECIEQSTMTPRRIDIGPRQHVSIRSIAVRVELLDCSLP